MASANDSASLFWADQLAQKIVARGKFHFTDERVPALSKWSVKSSSSLSGVLHIGRLSDIIRGEALYRALKETGFPADFIYVTEDMDPLRKVPQGVPASFAEYIGFSVSDVPCPFGCHESYALHFKEEFLAVFHDFLVVEPRVFSMREEYRKGSFNDSIVELVSQEKRVREIMDRFKREPTPEGWSPWKPICDRCGNLQTTVVTGVTSKSVRYVCRDYAFESTTARGCGFEGESLFSKANGKLAWKSEWAAQWKRWHVCSEGAGKEYESRNSAFWVNAEICERVLHFPGPEPIFYEHINIGGEKMSASKGNVVYPKDWLAVSRPEALKFLYMKKLTKARSFDWQDIPLLELELDRAVEATLTPPHESKEAQQLSRQTHFSKVAGRKLHPLPLSYSAAMESVQLAPAQVRIFEKLKEMGTLTGTESEEVRQALEERLVLARRWLDLYSPPESRLSFAAEPLPHLKENLSPIQRAALSKLIDLLPTVHLPDDMQAAVFQAAKAAGIQPPELFRILYQALLHRDRGPKAGTVISLFGRDATLKRLRSLL